MLIEEIEDFQRKLMEIGLATTQTLTFNDCGEVVSIRFDVREG